MSNEITIPNPLPTTLAGRLALLSKLVGPLEKRGEMRYEDDHRNVEYTFLRADDMKDRVNQLAYDCGVYISTGQYDQIPAHYERLEIKQPAFTRIDHLVRLAVFAQAQSVDNPDEKELRWAFGFAQGNDDKVFNKATSQGEKYAIRALLNLAARDGDSDDVVGRTNGTIHIAAEPTTVLDADEKVSLRSWIARLGLDEHEIVHKTSKGFADSLDDVRLQFRDIKRLKDNLRALFEEAKRMGALRPVAPVDEPSTSIQPEVPQPRADARTGQRHYLIRLCQSNNIQPDQLRELATANGHDFPAVDQIADLETAPFTAAAASSLIGKLQQPASPKYGTPAHRAS
ncbi:MAG: hypothetical protein EPN48_18465 [Microbacteriaceae bacterium]|nr:MAG: hypothetical protein EPN48_18465 [Microbacteriaceae bacterium]